MLITGTDSHVTIYPQCAILEDEDEIYGSDLAWPRFSNHANNVCAIVRRF